jgi:large subunit ribosomal protein L19e
MIMVDLRNQKMLAARVLKCGATRVWIDPAHGSDVAEAITADDIRKLISDGIIVAVPKKGISSYNIKKRKEQKRKGRSKGKGSRKGKLGTRMRKKEVWMKRIRAIRQMLRDLKQQKRIDSKVYRNIYRKSKSGFFRSKSHVMIYLERNNLLKQESKEKGAGNVQTEKK